MTTSVAAGERAMSDRLLGRAQEIGQAEMTRLLARTPKSAQLYQRAARTLPFGVVSSFQKMQPYPIYVTHGKGSHIWDQDGTEYLDFHCGFGAMVVGHAHPADRRGDPRGGEPRHPLRGHHRVGGGVRRGDLPAVQPRDAPVRQLGHRGDDGRHPGGPRGHRPRRGLQDRGLVSRPPRQRDVLDRPQRRPHGRPRPAGQRAGVEGHGRRTRPSTSQVVPFNDADHLERVLQERGHEIACLIMEPAMMNIGIVVPAARVPPARARAVHQARCGLHLRRDQDRAHDRRGRRHRALRRAAGSGLPRQGHLRRAPGRRLRRARGPDAAHRAWRVADGDLQRQPAGRRTSAWSTLTEVLRRRLSALRANRHPARPAAARPPSTDTASRPTRSTSAPRAASRTDGPR